MQIYEVEVALAAFFLIATVAVYGFVPWWKTWAGRILFAVLAGYAAVMTGVTVSFWLGDYPGRELVRHLTYGGTLLLSIVVFITMLSVQLRGKRRQKKLDSLISEGKDNG